MRKSRSETALTRQRILEEASLQIRQNGIAGTGVAEVMARAGLTAGGFYRHFSSKDQLVAEATTEAATHMVQRVTGAVAARDGKTGLTALLDSYVSTHHRDKIDSGCPFAATGSELARGSDTIRWASNDGFLQFVHLVASQLPGVSEETRRQRALAISASIIGALTMSRVVADSSLSEEILASVRAVLACE